MWPPAKTQAYHTRERSHDATRTSARQDFEERRPGVGRLCRGRNARGRRSSPTAVAAQFDGWQNVLAARLEELAVAISTGRPEIFVEQVHWNRAALEARGIPAEMLRARLEALRHVLVEQIPAELAPIATGYIDRALAEFGGEPAGLMPRLTARPRRSGWLRRTCWRSSKVIAVRRSV